VRPSGLLPFDQGTLRSPQSRFRDRHDRSPEVSFSAFHAQPPNLRSTPLMDMDFAVISQLVRRSRLIFGFCPSAQVFATCFLQTLPRDSRPCTSLILHLHQVGIRDLHPQTEKHARRTKKKPGTLSSAGLGGLNILVHDPRIRARRFIASLDLFGSADPIQSAPPIPSSIFGSAVNHRSITQFESGNRRGFPSHPAKAPIKPLRLFHSVIGAVPRGAILAPRWTDTNRELHGRDSAHARASNPYAPLLPQSPAASGFEHICDAEDLWLWRDFDRNTHDRKTPRYSAYCLRHNIN
jgi:hypothetical protein